jgi:hypothetical protein
VACQPGSVPPPGLPSDRLADPRPGGQRRTRGAPLDIRDALDVGGPYICPASGPYDSALYYIVHFWAGLDEPQRC